MNKMTPNDMNVLTDFLTPAGVAEESADLRPDVKTYDLTSLEEMVVLARREQAKFLAPYFKKFGTAVKGIFNFLFVSMYRDLRSFRTVNELSRLSDRELADIGITRWDIPRIAREDAQLRAANESSAHHNDVAA